MGMTVRRVKKTIEEKRADNGLLKPSARRTSRSKEDPTIPRLNELREALYLFEKLNGKELYKHLIERAFESDAVLAVLMKKLVPDLKQVSGSISANIHNTVDFSKLTQEEIDAQLKLFRASLSDGNEGTKD